MKGEKWRLKTNVADLSSISDGTENVIFITKTNEKLCSKIPAAVAIKICFISAVDNNAALYSLFFIFKCQFNKLNETSVKKKRKIYFYITYT